MKPKHPIKLNITREKKKGVIKMAKAVPKIKGAFPTINEPEF